MPLRTQTAQPETESTNLHVYRDPAVVSHYASLDYLTPCERFLFDTYLKPGMAILDIGVGGGRTSPYLSRQAGRYVGVDYSDEMVRLCQGKFPQLEFLVSDASDLSQFVDGSFDAIVFAFNGLDGVLPAEKRRQCLRECARLLKAGGVLIFSSHNPRSVLVLPAWDPQILHAFLRRLVPRPGVLFSAVLCLLTVAKPIHALWRALAASMTRIFRWVPSGAFWRGEGCRIDSAHGGLLTHCWTPARAVAETSTLGFRCETVLGNDYPKRSYQLVTDWYYYVFSKEENSAGGSCA